MKSLVSWFIFILLLGGIVTLWRSVPLPCTVPIRYSIGQFDVRFGLSQEVFLKDMARAEKLWEDALGRDVFQYTPGATLKTNLVFDERQARSLEEKQLDQSLGVVKTTQESLAKQHAAVKAAYDAAVKEYTASLTSFQNRLADYNNTVEVWNKQGGAPADEYGKLQKEAKALNGLQQDLEDKRARVNILAERVNTFSVQQVQVVDKYNSQVKNYVDRYGKGGESFNQGDYTGASIDIYQFDTEAQLRLVLAHELGHALGLNHVENAASVMYYLMGGQDTDSLALTTEDRAALKAVCSKSRWDDILERMRNLRQRLATIL